MRGAFFVSEQDDSSIDVASKALVVWSVFKKIMKFLAVPPFYPDVYEKLRC